MWKFLETLKEINTCVAKQAKHSDELWPFAQLLMSVGVFDEMDGSNCIILYHLHSPVTGEWRWYMQLKGKFPQTTMGIGWVESNFTNPTVKDWADLDNPFKRSDYAKLCTVALSGWNSARICDITRGHLSIDFVHKCSQFLIFIGYQ